MTARQPTLVHLLPGSSITFSCYFMGLPPPAVSWEHNGVAAIAGDGVGIVTGANSSELTVDEGTEERGGVYRCSVTNIAGNSSIDFTLLSKL